MRYGLSYVPELIERTPVMWTRTRKKFSILVEPVHYKKDLTQWRIQGGIKGFIHP